MEAEKMTKLAALRKSTRLKLREVAARVGVTAQTVHDAEIRGLKTIKSARKYAAAFPGTPWQKLID